MITKLNLYNESLRDKMTPISKEHLDDMIKGKSYKQSLDMAAKSDDPEWSKLIMMGDFKTSRQMDDVNMIFNKVLRNNYCKANYNPKVMVYNTLPYTLIYGGLMKVTKPVGYSELSIGITNPVESQIKKYKLDKDGNPESRQIFWFFVQYLVSTPNTPWKCKFFETSDEMVNFLKKLGFTI